MQARMQITKPSAARRLWRRILNHWEFYLLLIPMFVIIFVFKYIPMYGVQIALKNFKASMGIMGYAFVMAADDRLYNNIFVGGQGDLGSESATGTEGYNGRPFTFADYKVRIDTSDISEHVRFMHIPQPVYIDANAYYDGAKAYDEEENRFETQALLGAKLVEETGEVYLEMDVEEGMLSLPTRVHSTLTLGHPRIVGTPFDQPDGSLMTLDTDYLGEKREDGCAAGPFSKLVPGKNRIRVW